MYLNYDGAKLSVESVESNNSVESRDVENHIKNATLKTILNYLAYLKVEVTKISDIQQEIIDSINNSRSNITTFNSSIGDTDYFVTAWLISNYEELNFKLIFLWVMAFKTIPANKFAAIFPYPLQLLFAVYLVLLL
ncbi:uncharacterized protein LOC112693904 [Sipha flava]|uniref:Uncharacterized protein LOC112693904 n=1 Tax=Sipha flava TaxID=143950 RepID=A0A8B8GNV9_9HEMI|nr:uncharacterized protein LOC112693904 [Sipha flava]